jgi:hypothetical protein
MILSKDKEASDRHNVIMKGERDHTSRKEMVKVSRDYRKYAREMARETIEQLTGD